MNTVAVHVAVALWSMQDGIFGKLSVIVET